MIGRKGWIYLCLALGAGTLSAQSISYLANNPNGHAFEFVARADQNGDNASSYGYLSHLNGIDDGLLFSSTVGPAGTKSEVNARFAIVSTLTFTSRLVNANIVTAVQDETFQVYYTEFPTARDFTKPDTFRQGTVIATFHNRVQTILNVQTPLSEAGPGRGIIQATTDSNQVGGEVFTLDGKSYALGQIGTNFRLGATGQGTLTSANPFIASFVFSGYAEQAGRRPVLRF